MFIVILFNIIVYCIAFSFISNLGGYKKNLPFSFSLAIFIVYYLITPTYFFYSGRKTIWGDEKVFATVGVDISDYYVTVLLYYGIANIFYILGYIIPKTKKKFILKGKKLFEIKLINPQRTIVVLFSIIFFIVLANFVFYGFNISALLIGDESQALGGNAGLSNYIKNIVDSLIILLVIAFHFDVRRSILLVMTTLSFILFGLLFFRYRIILTLLGFIFSYLYKKKENKINIVRTTILLAVSFYFVLFFTVNRNTLLNADWKSISFSLAEFDYGVIFEQTRGMLDDINIIKHYEIIDTNEKYEYGMNFFYVFVRLLPRSLVGDEYKDSFYPPPIYEIVTRAYALPYNWGNQGEAPLHYAYFYMAGGLFGLFFLSFLSGFFIRMFQNRYPANNDLYIILNIAVSLALFQLITRGYFPQFVDHLSYLLLGYWLFVKLVSKKKSKV